MGQSLKFHSPFAREDSRVPNVVAPLAKSGELWLAVHCPGLEPAARSHAHESLVEPSRARLEQLASRAFAYTPKVSLQPPQAVLLEVAGSQRLFGGLAAIKSALARALGNEQPFCMAAAPRPLAALWLARGRGRDLTAYHELAGGLGPLDLEVTAWPQRTQLALGEMGIRTIADCLRLPRAGFARRIGAAYLLDLDKALGRAPDLRPSFVPSTRLSYVEQSAWEIKSAALLLPVVERLLARLVAELRMRQAQIRSLELTLFHVRAASTVLRIELVEPSHRRHRLLRLIADKLERLRLRESVVAVALQAGPLQSMTRLDTSSWLPDHNECAIEAHEAAAQLVELLQGRLGTQNVFCVAQIADHRPEKAWEKAAFPIRERTVPLLACSTRRPLWLLSRAVRLSGCTEPLYEGRPLVLVSGPERIETGWWERDVGRDYYRADAVTGESLWVYRERARPVWYLHGLFG